MLRWRYCRRHADGGRHLLHGICQRKLDHDGIARALKNLRGGRHAAGFLTVGNKLRNCTVPGQALESK